MATIVDVAKLAGVTPTTVSRVINNRGYISEKTRNKVYGAMDELGYQPNEIARSLTKQKSNTIGVIVPHISHPYFAKLISNLENEASKKDYKIILCNSKEKAEKESSLALLEENLVQNNQKLNRLEAELLVFSDDPDQMIELLRERFVALLQEEADVSNQLTRIENELENSRQLSQKQADQLEKLKEQFVLVMGHTPEELLNLVSPSFRPAGLLVKPVKKEKLEHLLSEVWKEYKKAQTRENMFSLKIRSQEYVLPQSKILFFESRNKKIVLRTSTQEIEFYDTLEHLQSVLNKDFIRIHKSFLVNISLVTMVHFSNMMVHFNGGVFVPVSRTYKAVLSEKWKQRKEKLWG